MRMGAAQLLQTRKKHGAPPITIKEGALVTKKEETIKKRKPVTTKEGAPFIMKDKTSVKGGTRTKKNGASGGRSRGKEKCCVPRRQLTRRNMRKFWMMMMSIETLGKIMGNSAKRGNRSMNREERVLLVD